MWYIEYNGEKFYTLFDAIERLQKKLGEAYLNFHDDEFSKFDWSIEPIESFELLKYQRAKQIRDSYDYVRIFASYAADSGTVVNTFLKNNLQIDEIVNYVSKWENNLTSLEQEHHTLFVPKIKEFLKETRKTIITVSEITADTVAKVMSCKNPNRSGVLPTRYNPTQLNERFFLNKKFVDVHGELKPVVFIDKGRFYTRFSLPYVHDLLSRDYFGSIDFFTTPDFPKLHIKQCHLLKNAIKKYLPNLILDSFNNGIVMSEVGSDRIQKLMPNLVTETFIENCCRDFNDFGLTPTFGVKSGQPILGALNAKEVVRISGFYKSNKLLLKDYLDYVKDFYKSPFFETRNGKISKVRMKSKIYDLGK